MIKFHPAHVCALFNKKRNEKNPRAKVCQNQPFEFAGSTFCDRRHAYIASTMCAAAAIQKTIWMPRSDLNNRSAKALRSDSGPKTGKNATAKREVIPITQNSHVNIVGPSRLCLFLSCQYEIVAAMPSVVLTIGT